MESHFLFSQKTLFLFMYMSVCLHMCMPPVCGGPPRLEEGIEATGTAVTGKWELPNVGAGN